MIGYIIAFISTLMLGFGAGYSTHSKLAEVKYSKQLEQVIAETKKQAELDKKIETVYIEKQGETEIVYKTIVKEIPKYVTVIQKEDSDCNLSNGVVWLLNDLSQNRVPNASPESYETHKTPSLIRETDLIYYTKDVILEYNNIMNQCNSLIDWVNGVGTNGD